MCYVQVVSIWLEFEVALHGCNIFRSSYQLRYVTLPFGHLQSEIPYTENHVNDRFKENLGEEDNIRTRNKCPVPNVSFFGGFTVDIVVL